MRVRVGLGLGLWLGLGLGLRLAWGWGWGWGWGWTALPTLLTPRESLRLPSMPPLPAERSSPTAAPPPSCSAKSAPCSNAHSSCFMDAAAA